MSNLYAEHFQDADKAREYLERLRWPNGQVCPHCGVEGKHWPIKTKRRKGLYKCREYRCGKQFTVTVGTVFERSKVPLNKWLAATHLMCASKKGISAHQIHRMLGVTYKTAWFMCHRIREAMKESMTGKLGGSGGTVEADETFWGQTKGSKKRRGWSHKMKIFALVDRESGKTRSFHVPDINLKTLGPILRAHVSDMSTLMTDDAGVYKGMHHYFEHHESVNHSAGEYVRGTAHTNTIECQFSLLKRGLVGTFHHVGQQHLRRYVTEFDFRWNYRVKLGFDDVDRTHICLENIMGKRLTYRRTHEARH